MVIHKIQTFKKMKKLNQMGTSTMSTLISMLEVGTNKIKIDYSHGTFMAVIIERLNEFEKYKIFSIAHYYEQQEIQICDTEMRFILNKNTGEYFPSYYKDSKGLEKESIKMIVGVIISVKIIQQLEHSLVGNQFLERIKFQQNL